LPTLTAPPRAVDLPRIPFYALERGNNVPKLRETIHLDVGSGYDISVIEADGKLWIGATASHPNGMVRFWSRKEEVGVQPLPVGEVVHLIQQSLYGWEAGLLSDTDILHFWPVGWDFGGPGYPLR
jgi:hypothetical protein